MLDINHLYIDSDYTPFNIISISLVEQTAKKYY